MTENTTEQKTAGKSDQTNTKEQSAPDSNKKPSPAGENKRTQAPGQKTVNLQQNQAEFVRHIAGKTAHRPGLNVQAVQNLKNLAEKIRAKAQLMKGNAVTVLEARLSPAKLGTVRIQIEISGDQMRLILAAERPEAAAALQNARSDLAALVSDHGYNLTRCDVEDRYPQSKGSETHPHGGTNRRGFRGQVEDESESRGRDDDQHTRRMIDWGYNTMELVA
jgi:flagellar hook-length control protein FliK